MIFYLVIAISFFSLSTADCAIKPPRSKVSFVEGSLVAGRLGNQFFEVAAALSLAMDHNVEAYFPDFKLKKTEGVPVYAEKVFFRVNQNKPPSKPFYTYAENADFIYYPIPYKPRIKLHGYFQSELYFKHNWAKIRPYLEASDSIKTYLNEKYPYIINHPHTVGLHIRDYNNENAWLSNVFWALDEDYVLRAMDQFEEGALFVVFSDNMDRAKQILAHTYRPLIYIEDEKDYHDLYLMSFMKHQIISNSTFSWWAAYLNDNPDKKVVAPKKWFKPTYHVKSDYIIPDSWIQLD